MVGFEEGDNAERINRMFPVFRSAPSASAAEQRKGSAKKGAYREGGTEGRGASKDADLDDILRRIEEIRRKLEK